jgi:uracil-DNA glycosylase
MERGFQLKIRGLEGTGLVSAILRFQQEAKIIKPPSKTDLLPTRGGLPGPAFFPEGLGLSGSALHQGTLPTIIAVGHNFGCADYREAIQAAGREDDKATWRNLDRLLVQAGSRPELCFRTNWFVGLLPGKVQIGKFLRSSDLIYENACNRLLIAQIKLIQPKAILILGPEVAGRAYQIVPALAPWRRASRWSDIDRSSIGHSPRNVHIPAAGISTNIVALLHPSFAAVNQSGRMKRMLEPVSEAEIVRAALQV